MHAPRGKTSRVVAISRGRGPGSEVSAGAPAVHTAAAIDPFDRLLGEHRALVELFTRHQCALIERRWLEAAWLLERYARDLRRHIDFEERFVLPRCVGAPGTRWPGALYRAEHRRIEQLLGKAADRLASAHRSEITAAVIIELLDAERVLKHLVAHHHEREEQALFVELRMSRSD